MKIYSNKYEMISIIVKDQLCLKVMQKSIEMPEIKSLVLKRSKFGFSSSHFSKLVENDYWIS